MSFVQFSKYLKFSVEDKILKKLKSQSKLIIVSHLYSTNNKVGMNSHPAYLCGSNSTIINLVNENFKVYENFISETEEENLLKEIEPVFKRRRYQFDHWDGAIQGYKETEKDKWNEENYMVLQRMKNVAFSSKHIPMKHVHVLDLSKTGHIKPHIDSIKFCGRIIAGISLLSSSVMRLILDADKSQLVDVLLQRRSLYVMKDIARYEFTHEILPDSSSNFKGIPIPRERRVSLMCRLEPDTAREDKT